MKGRETREILARFGSIYRLATSGSPRSRAATLRRCAGSMRNAPESGMNSSAAVMDRFHQTALGVDLRRQQIVAQLVRQRPAHRPRQQRLALRDRHLRRRCRRRRAPPPSSAWRWRTTGRSPAPAPSHRRTRSSRAGARPLVPTPRFVADDDVERVRHERSGSARARPAWRRARACHTKVTPLGTPDRVGFGEERA